tara:strand:+ start:1964 stop:2704 length:741 start_codon:yes stop_codon:yes gene_type:complete
MVSRREMVVELLKQYRRNPDQFSDRQAEKIAKMAQEAGVHFPRESKFGRKLAFDFADTALLGLLPNEWRPTSRGESVFGETSQDKWAGRLGWLGAVPTAGAGIAGRGAIWAGAKGLGKAGLGAGASAYGAGARAVSNYAPKAQAYYSQLVRNAPDMVSRAGVKANNVRMYARQKASNLTSLEKGNPTTWVSNLRDNFTEPWRQQNLLDQALRTGSSRIGTRLSINTPTQMAMSQGIGVDNMLARMR